MVRSTICSIIDHMLNIDKMCYMLTKDGLFLLELKRMMEKYRQS